MSWLTLRDSSGTTRRRGRLLVGAMVVSVVLGACAIPPMTVDEYAEALNGATEDYVGESQALSTAFQKTVEEEIAELADAGEGNLIALATGVTSREMIQYFALLEDAMERYGKELDGMRPPVNLGELHDDYLSAIESVRIALPETRDNVAEAHDLVGIQEAITGSGFADGQLRLQSSCLALEEAVRAEGHGADLACTRPLTGG